MLKESYSQSLVSQYWMESNTLQSLGQSGWLIFYSAGY
uniref:Uncharacterized protein n=1 Tax=Anguilla anguilla TaxID=7936 RepID=A0A0E9UN60_ANGAN